MREYIRHKLSAILADRPLKCNIPIKEGQGLSSLEMPHVVEIFKDSEGIIWFTIYGISEPIEFDDLSDNDLITIINDESICS